MTVQHFEIGLVSADAALARFLADAFELELHAPDDYGAVVLHRLGTPGATLKVVVPKERPADRDADTFLERAGLRYLTMHVEDVARIVDRWRSAGGTVHMEPFEFAPGSCLALLCDPDGNTYEVVGPA